MLLLGPKVYGVDMSDGLMTVLTRVYADALALRFHLTCLVLSFGCSGMPAAGSACRATYDECVNACAHHCDQENRLQPHTNHLTASADTWGRGCKLCVERCRTVVKACTEARSHR